MSQSLGNKLKTAYDSDSSGSNRSDDGNKMRYKTILLFGAPGSGKGTQGKILGSIPGMFHTACGDVFRQLDLKSDLGKKFWEFSSKGNLVPDDLTVKLWKQFIDGAERTNRF